MDTLHKVISNGILSYFLQDQNDPDVEAWVCYKVLRPPTMADEKRPKFFFNLPNVDQIFEGIQGLWEIHGKKNTGKSFLCRKLAESTDKKVLYVCQSAAVGEEFCEIVRGT